ncbi:MAG: hypothetical protein ACK4GO_14130 [Gemmobacter sp.]
MAARDHRAALDLSHRAAPETYWAPNLSRLRVLAAAGLRDADLLADEVAALRERANADVALRDVVINLGFHLLLAPGPEDFRWAWGTPRATIEDQLADLTAAQGRRFVPRWSDRRLHGMRRDGLEFAAFSDRLARGLAMMHFLSHLKRLDSRLARLIGPLTPEECLIRALHGQIARVLVTPDLTPILQAQSEGRSIVIAGIHTAVGAHLWREGAELTLPQARIFRRALTGADAETLNISSTAPDMPLRYLRLLKAMRRAPHIVEVFPDGADGGETLAPLLCGHPVRIGRGAAHLAWQSKAATFVPVMGWDGVRYVSTLREGPSPQDHAAADDYDAAFADFYVGCLADMLQGPPEAISGPLLHHGAPWRRSSPAIPSAP